MHVLIFCNFLQLQYQLTFANHHLVVRTVFASTTMATLSALVSPTLLERHLTVGPSVLAAPSVIRIWLVYHKNARILVRALVDSMPDVRLSTTVPYALVHRILLEIRLCDVCRRVSLFFFNCKYLFTFLDEVRALRELHILAK